MCRLEKKNYAAIKRCDTSNNGTAAKRIKRINSTVTAAARSHLGIVDRPRARSGRREINSSLAGGRVSAGAGSRRVRQSKVTRTVITVRKTVSREKLSRFQFSIFSKTDSCFFVHFFPRRKRENVL